MKTIAVIVLVLMTSIGTHAQKVQKLWETDTVFKVPESTLFHADIIYVSNVNGSPGEKNSLGFISKISSEGDLIALKWVEGLHAPKGMGIFNNTLYVSDVDRVAVIDIKKGVVVKFIEVPHAKFLNDIAISPDGVVAVSDMQDATIHFIEGNELAFKINAPNLAGVNGLCWPDRLLYAGTKNIIFEIDLKSKTPMPKINGTGGVDGLEQWDENRFVISDWQGKVQVVSATADPVVLFNTTETGKNAADIGLILERKTVLVPTFFGNTVVAYEIIE